MIPKAELVVRFPVWRPFAPEHIAVSERKSHLPEIKLLLRSKESNCDEDEETERMDSSV